MHVGRNLFIIVNLKYSWALPRYGTIKYYHDMEIATRDRENGLSMC